MDLATEIALVSLGIAVVGLVLALVRVWLHVRVLDAEKRRFDAFIAELRRLADAGNSSVALQARSVAASESAQLAILQSQAQAANLQQQALQHKKMMDYAQLALGIWDRIRASDEEEEDE